MTTNRPIAAASLGQETAWVHRLARQLVRDEHLAGVHALSHQHMRRDHTAGYRRLY